MRKRNFQRNIRMTENENEQKADKKQFEARMELLLTALEMISNDKSNNYNYHLPLTVLGGQAKKESAIEEAKGRGLDWEYVYEK